MVSETEEFDKNAIMNSKKRKKLYDKKYREDNRDRIKRLRKKYDEENKDKIALRDKIYREANKDKIAFHDKEYYENNKDKILARTKIYHEIHGEEERLRDKKYRKNLRVNAISYYSNGTMSCVCCGEKHIEFLTLDHINNDGAKHRRENKKISGSNLYRWLKDNNYPEGFQVLCWNCNACKGYFGECYHKNKDIKYKNETSDKYNLMILDWYTAGTMKCACCGEDVRFFLCKDHIFGGGVKHHRELKERGISLNRELINNNYPNGYRILCHNCNSSLGYYGYCPHGNEIPTDVGYKYTEIDEDMFA